ncbi:putative conserved mitochondrial protein [Purpureocillium lavendulum]|uniref:Conserved mitochondrial protein n=1 Tax=Purpureocillium lavendulum TaxID=1247861 RepID=A0AB34FTK8_9HYPO|nr:putative conserved mitochondrial protein [Purpureocillium lavendulum]
MSHDRDDDDERAHRSRRDTNTPIRQSRDSSSSSSSSNSSMTKLSPSLKALINAPFARPGQVPAPRGIADVYARIAREAEQHRVGTNPWLAISAAATFTLNSPDSLAVLHRVATERGAAPVPAAELVREVGLKCISFNGIPRTINCLNAFRAGLPADVAARLHGRASRVPTPEVGSPNGVDAVAARARTLWDSVYAPFEDKLVDKLALAHPDLPVHILNSHYGPLLSDPPPPPPPAPAASEGPESEAGTALARTGRVLTSAVAVACLRAQTGVGPQVLSHVFGLRKACEDGTWRGDAEAGIVDEEVVRWLASDEGCEWLLRSVDGIVEALGGSSFGGNNAAPKL